MERRRPGIRKKKIDHVSVMVSEVLELLQVGLGGVYIDGTLGLGGHALEILLASGQTGRLIGIDRDAQAIAQAKNNLRAVERQILFFQGTFDNMEECWRSSGCSEADAVLLDLGLSSLQIEDSSRGFSFLGDDILDMRMDTGQTLTARAVVNEYPEKKLLKILFEYGEERFSRRIVRAILQERKRQTIETTKQLAQVVARAVFSGRRSRIHPATRTFQALRIEVNQELKILENFLKGSMSFLKVGGRLGIISFHSLEDRQAKIFGRQRDDFSPINKKPLVPTEEEMIRNPRARSAKLRVFEKKETRKQ